MEKIGKAKRLSSFRNSRMVRRESEISRDREREGERVRLRERDRERKHNAESFHGFC